MTAEAHHVPISAEGAQRIAGGIRTLPPHPEVAASLEFLRRAGFRIVTLRISSRTIVDAQMQAAGLQPYFERNFSVDTVRKFKPAPEPYRMVAGALGVECSNLRMIAAHAWDTRRSHAGWLRGGLRRAPR